MLKKIKLFLLQNKMQLVKWILAGLFFMGISSIFLYIFVEIFYVSMVWATLLSAELCTLLRYFINSIWIFKVNKCTVKSCIQYHIANGGAFLVWWSTANLFVLFGMYYIVAGALAVGASIFFSLFSNFFWVWKKEKV